MIWRCSDDAKYGYQKSPNDREQWLIDEPAAEVVRKIFNLCLAGRGPSQIARDLEAAKILTPTAYFNSVGRATRNPVPVNPYLWASDAVKHILENRQYTGCAVNLKSTTVSFKVHKKIYNPAEEQQIIPNMQEPIISEELFDRVQELRSHKRRNTKTGRKSLFAGLLYCPDCGAKLHFCAARSLKLNQEFYRCANYNSGRGTCDIHYIRNVVLEQIVAEAVGSLADFVRCYESVFLYLPAKNNNVARQSEVQKLKQSLATSERRIKMIDKAIEELFEANISGKVSDERFVKMTDNYEKEQKELLELVADGNKKLQDAEQNKVDLKLLMKALRDYTDIRQLTPEIVNALIRRIEVHSKDKKTKKVKVDIYLTAVGLFTPPTEQELQMAMEEIRRNQQQFGISAQSRTRCSPHFQGYTVSYIIITSLWVCVEWRRLFFFFLFFSFVNDMSQKSQKIPH